MADLIDGLLCYLFLAALGGTAYFGAVLGVRAYAAHQRGLHRLRTTTRKEARHGS